MNASQNPSSRRDFLRSSSAAAAVAFAAPAILGREQAFATPPMACAVWYVPQKQCTIVTSPKVTHTVLGHEVRHCFEGHFH